MLAATVRYTTAWAEHADDSAGFLAEMVQVVRHSRLALESSTPGTSFSDAAGWNLGVAVAYMQAREAVVDRYNIPAAVSWEAALSDAVRSVPAAWLRLVGDDVGAENGGLVVELGVASGSSIKVIDEVLSAEGATVQVHGFDSFLGLPHAWGGEASSMSARFPKDKFDLDGKAPDSLPARVQLHQGLFSDTIPRWVASMPPGSFLAFVHVDCDTFPSTFEALSALVCLLRPGTIIAFDEVFGYLEWKRAGEWRAWTEIVDLYGLQWEGVHHFKMRLSVRIKHAVVAGHPVCAGRHRQKNFYSQMFDMVRNDITKRFGEK